MNNRRLPTPLLAGSALFVLSLATEAETNKRYVSPGGMDSNPGTIEQPFGTIDAALGSLDQRKGSEIILRGGTYRQQRTLSLGKSDSGAKGAPLAIRAYEGEKVIITGGRQIPSKLFKHLPGTANHQKHFADASRGNLFVASLDGTGLEEFFTYRPDLNNHQDYPLVSWSGHTLQLAQWPNRGYGYVSKTHDKGAAIRWLKPGEKAEPFDWKKPSGAIFSAHEKLDLPALHSELDRTGDISVQGFLAVDWHFETVPLAKIGTKEKTLQLLHHLRYGMDFQSLKMPRRFRLVNTLRYLDEPGEWYYDHKEKLFYIWPVVPLSDEQPLTVTGGPSFISGKGVDHLEITGITFENFGKIAVEFESSNHVLIGGCVFRNGGGLALSMTDGTHNSIIGCDFFNLDRAFVLLGQDPRPEALENDTIVFRDPNADYIKAGYSENRKNLVPEHNVASNNHIHHCRHRAYGLAKIGGVGATFSHNLMHDLNGGVIFGHNNLAMEYNEFYEVGYEMGDWNICYNGADKALMNNQVRNNFFHHMIQTPTAYHIAAIRVDDYGTGLDVSNSIFYKTGLSAVTFRGPFSSMENCVVMEMPKLWHTTQLPKHEIPRDQYFNEAWDAHLRMQNDIAAGEYCIHEKENYIGRIELAIGKEGWNTNEQWKNAYPKYQSMFKNPRDPECNPWNQSHCSVRNNYHDSASVKSFSIHGNNKLETIEQIRAFLPASMDIEIPHKLDPKKMFVAPGKLDFRMRDDFKPAEGFEPIPFEKIGLRLDRYRTEMPDKSAYRQAVRTKYEGVKSYAGRFDRKEVNSRYEPPSYLRSDGR